MTISEMIEALEAIRDEHGDLYVELRDGTLVQELVPVKSDDDEVVAARVG